ncbi:MAG TPA: FtsX-like permease family protein, partial [Acidimicrobiales bacterium]|nr:FtsX-like permease family protein [Acidimicrobiales bacterium]
VPVVQGVSLLEGPDDVTVTILGVDCRVEVLFGPVGCTDDAVAAGGDRPLVVGPGVAEDGRVRTQGDSVPVAGAPVDDGLAAIGEGRVVVFGLGAAQRLFARDGRLDVVYVEPAPGTDIAALRARLDDAVGEQNTVLDADEGPPEVSSTLDAALPMFTLIAVFALGIGGMLVHNTAALSVEERRRDLAVLSALGGTPRSLAVATLGEAAVIGAAGGVVGAAAGLGVAGPIVASMSRYTERVAGIPLAVHLSWPGVVAAVALGLIVSVLAAWLPVRRALRADVSAELSGRDRRERTTTHSQLRGAAPWAALTVAGLVAVELSGRDNGIEFWQVPAGALGFGVVTLALTLVGAKLAPLALRPLGRAVAGSAPLRLAVANLIREPRRTGTMVVAVGAASTTAFMTAGYINGARIGITDNVLADVDGVRVTVVSSGPNANLDTGASPELLAVLDDVPGAEPVARRWAGVLTGARLDDLVFVSAGQDVTFDGEMVRGAVDEAEFERGGAVINVVLARDTGLRPGDTLRLGAPAGSFDVPILAVVEGGGPGDRGAQIPYDLFLEHYTVPPPRSVMIEPAPGTSIAELERAVLGAVDDAAASGLISDTDVRVLTPADIAAESVDGVSRELAPFWTLQRALMAVSFVAVLSTLLLVGMQRRREMGVLGAVGMEPGVLARMVLAEAGLVGLLGVALTATGGFVMLWALNRVAPLLIGWANPLAPDWWSLLVWGVVSTLVAVVAAAWPARRAAHTEIVPALQHE